jgi:ketosteroid isomerase-like protein
MRQEYRSSKHPLTFGNVRCITADTAVVDGKWELRGVFDASGKPLPTYEGLLTLVMARGQTGGWAIEAYRYTQKPAAAPMPTWLKRPGYPGGGAIPNQ